MIISAGCFTIEVTSRKLVSLPGEHWKRFKEEFLDDVDRCD